MVQYIKVMIMRTIVINKNDANQRVDKFLGKLFRSKMPKSLLYKYIRKKRVKLNGSRCAPEDILSEGDVLNLYINDEFFADKDIEETPFNLDIIYEDENIILIDKPTGLVVHADSRGSKNTLINQILSYLKDKGEYLPQKENSFTPALCNRIDKNTRGIVIAAKNAQALRCMNNIIKHHMVKKKYLALCEGVIKQDRGVLKGYLYKDSKQNKAYVSKLPKEGAKYVETAYEVIGRRASSTALQVELITGRTHQIRAHFASIGHPLVGDKKYGSKNSQFKYQALYATSLEFLDGFEDTLLSYLSGKTFSILDSLNPGELFPY